MDIYSIDNDFPDDSGRITLNINGKQYTVYARISYEIGIIIATKHELTAQILYQQITTKEVLNFAYDLLAKMVNDPAIYPDYLKKHLAASTVITTIQCVAFPFFATIQKYGSTLIGKITTDTKQPSKSSSGKMRWRRLTALILNTFPAYKESDLLSMPFFSVIDLYNRALEMVSGENLPDPKAQNVETRSNELTYNPKTRQYE